MRRNFLGGVFGQSAGLASTVVIQLTQIPILIWALGTFGYGQYLIVIAFPSLLVLSDFGVLAAFSTAMLQAVASGQLDRARELSRLASAILLSIAVIAAAGIFGGGILLSQSSSDLPPWTFAVFVLYGAYALVNIQTNANEGILRAHGDQAKTWTFVAALRLIEFMCAAGAIAATKDPIVFVATLLTARVVGTVILGMRARRIATWASRVPTLVHWRKYQFLVKPMLGSLSQPATNYLYLQGTVVAVGVILGPVAVAQLSVLRTLSGLLKQGAQVFTIAAVPLITRNSAIGDTKGVTSRTAQTAVLVSCSIVPAAVVLSIFGPGFVSWWTHGTVSTSIALVVLFVVEAICEATLAIASMGLIAQNRHFVLSVCSLLIAGLYIAAIWIAQPPSLETLVIFQIVAILISIFVAISLQKRRKK